jgi:hypothetical protein
MPRKGVIGLANPQIFETLAVAGEKLAQGTVEEGFSEPAGTGEKDVINGISDKKIVYVVGFVSIQIVAIN